MNMKKKVLPLFLAVGLMITASITVLADEALTESNTDNNTSTSEDYDFKKFKWGDTQEYVESIEGEPSSEDDMKDVNAHYIAYDTTVAGKDALLAYYFCDDGLYQTRYILTEKHSNENMYIDDFNTVIDALKKKYGEPDTEWERWQDDDKKDYYSGKKGDALSYGYLNYYTWWEDINNRTDVFASMSADNYVISTTIDFSSTDLSAGEADYSDDF